VKRYSDSGMKLYFRTGAATCSPDIYDYFKGKKVLYAAGLKANNRLYEEIDHLMGMPVGRPSAKPKVFYHDFPCRAGSWDRSRRAAGRVERHRGELFPRIGSIVTNLSRVAKKAVRFYNYNKRGSCENRIKEGKYALAWTGLPCAGSSSEKVRLALFVLAYNLGNFLRRFALPPEVSRWSLSSVQLKPIKIGAKVIGHSRRTVFQMAEVAVPGALFAGVLARIRSRPSLPPEAAETKGQAHIKHTSGDQASSNMAESEVLHATVGRSIIDKGDSRLRMRECCISLSCGMVGY